MSALKLPLVVPRSRTVQLGAGASATSQTLKADMVGQSLADIRAYMQFLLGKEIAAQTQRGNPPTITEVDGNKNTAISAAQRKVVVLFGTSLPVAALDQVLNLLLQNIAATTTPDTGRLGTAAGWEWQHVRNGRRVPITGTSINFGPRDFLVLRPRLGYATVANVKVAGGSKSLTYNPANAKRVAKRNQRLGFMAATARQCRQVPDLLPFSVTVGLSSAYPAPGERWKRGTQYLILAPRVRRQYRS